MMYFIMFFIGFVVGATRERVLNDIEKSKSKSNDQV